MVFALSQRPGVNVSSATGHHGVSLGSGTLRLLFREGSAAPNMMSPYPPASLIAAILGRFLGKVLLVGVLIGVVVKFFDTRPSTGNSTSTYWGVFGEPSMRDRGGTWRDPWNSGLAGPMATSPS
jgi:hypothetical protein